MKVLYHANCNDGAAAALAVYMVYGAKAEYIPCQYGYDPPEITPGETVIMVDFSYKRPVLEKMASIAGSILILDHHKTAEAEIVGLDLPNVEAHFDMDKSGAILAWEYFHPTQPTPMLYMHIQDRDIWMWKLGVFSRWVHLALQLYPDWKMWGLFFDENDGCDKLYKMGEAIDGYQKIQVSKVIKTGPQPWFGYVVPLYNLPGHMISDTLHAALERYPEAPFGVAYFDLPAEGKRVYSLRSDGEFDVSELAKRYGGGGHANAAGFTVHIAAPEGVN